MNGKSDEIAKRKEAGDQLQISRTFPIDYLNSFPLPIHTHNLITIQEDNQETSNPKLHIMAPDFIQRHHQHLRLGVSTACHLRLFSVVRIYCPSCIEDCM